MLIVFLKMFHQPTVMGGENEKKKNKKEREKKERQKESKGWRERWAEWSLPNSEHHRKAGPLGIDPK